MAFMLWQKNFILRIWVKDRWIEKLQKFIFQNFHHENEPKFLQFIVFDILVKVTDSKIFRICGGILLLGLIVAPWAWVGVLLNEDKAETEIESGSEIDKVLFNNKFFE